VPGATVIFEAVDGESYRYRCGYRHFSKRWREDLRFCTYLVGLAVASWLGGNVVSGLRTPAYDALVRAHSASHWISHKQFQVLSLFIRALTSRPGGMALGVIGFAVVMRMSGEPASHPAFYIEADE
jgi:hypothetical protein